MMQSIILALKSPTGTHTYNILTRLRESPASIKCSKHMRAVLNSFPVLWSIWNTPQYPPPLFLQCWPSHCVLLASGTVSSSHHSITSSVAPTGDLSTHSGPWTFICLSRSKSFHPVPFNAPSFCLPLLPPLPCIHSSVGMSSVFPAFEGFSGC